MAAAAGLRVVLIEAARLGGTCVNLGCVPKKLMVYAGHYRTDHSDAVAYGLVHAQPKFEWPQLIQAIHQQVGRLNAVYGRLLEDAGCAVLQGWGRITGPNSVAVNGETIEAKHILIATGGRPIRPNIPGAEHGWISDAVFSLPDLPSSLLVVGGGYIAVEMASIFNALGTKVSLVHRGAQLLRGFDVDLPMALQRELVRRGISLILDTEVMAITPQAEGLEVQLSGGSSQQVNALLFATGRGPNTEGLGLADIGVACSDSGAIVVDDDYRSNVASIFAIGDVIGRVALTPVAIAEAMRFYRQLLGEVVPPLDYRGVPTAVFSSPEVGTVGWTEQAARGAGYAVRVYRSEFRTLRHAVSGRQERCLIKLVVDAATDRVLGLHMLGPEAAEVIQGFAVALTAGATKQDFDRTIAIHPSFAEEFVTLRTAVD